MRPSVTRQPATNPFGKFEDLFHFGKADDAFPRLGFEHSGHRFFDLIDELVK
jgi:hypothetical protein